MKNAKKTIVVTASSFCQYDNAPVDILRRRGLNVEMNPCKKKLGSEELLGFCKNAVGIIAGTETLDASILKRLGNLKVISRCGTGLENVDLEFAGKANIRVYNTPDAPTLAVAELTIGAIISLLRKINQMDQAMRRGRWEKLTGNLLYSKTVGILGFGRIGRKVAELLKPFGCIVQYSDPLAEDNIMGLRRVPFQAILRNSDIVTIHASTRKELLGKKQILSMKRGAWIVNMSRGDVMDEKTLYGALRSGHIAGAALDVFSKEPYNGRLTELKNVILTPHIGSYAKESRIRMELEAAKNLIKGLEEER